MPKIKRTSIPPALFQHLLTRIRDRRISAAQLQELAAWLDSEPEVPLEPWFKRFSGMFVCGDGELVKTFLLLEQLPSGVELS